MRTWKHDPPRRPGRLESDCSAPLADQRRVLLVGENDDWRLLTSYLFEDEGYTAYAAGDGRQAVRWSPACCRTWWSCRWTRPMASTC